MKQTTNYVRIFLYFNTERKSNRSGTHQIIVPITILSCLLFCYVRLLLLWNRKRSLRSEYSHSGRERMKTHQIQVPFSEKKSWNSHLARNRKKRKIKRPLKWNSEIRLKRTENHRENKVLSICQVWQFEKTFPIRS